MIASRYNYRLVVTGFIRLEDLYLLEPDLFHMGSKLLGRDRPIVPEKMTGDPLITRHLPSDVEVNQIAALASQSHT